VKLYAVASLKGCCPRVIWFRWLAERRAGRAVRGGIVDGRRIKEKI
jgi:hypothetical protein